MNIGNTFTNITRNYSMGWRHSCFSRGHYNSVSLCQSCQQTSCFQKLLGRLWSRGTVCWRTWTVNVECSNFRFGKRPFRHMYLDFKRVLFCLQGESMRGCILTCDQNGCNEAPSLDGHHVAVISGPVILSVIISNITGFHSMHHIICHIVIPCITSYRGQKDANSSLAIVSFSLYCLVLCYFLIGSNMHFTFCSFKTDKKKTSI